MENKEEIGSSEIEIHLHEGKHLPKQYRNLILSRWMHSYRRGNDYIKLINPQAYYSAYEVYILHILNRPLTSVRLAVLADDHDVVLGFGVSEGTMLHYVEVPKAYRRNGIGANLVPEKIEWFSHLTKIGMKLWAQKSPYAKFNPFT